MATNHLNPHIFHPPGTVESVARAYETAFWRQEPYALRSQCLCRAFCPSSVLHLHPRCPQPSLWPGLDAAHYHGSAHGFFRFLQRNPAKRACARSDGRGRNSGTHNGSTGASRGSDGTDKGKAAKKSSEAGTHRKTGTSGEKKRPRTSTGKKARARSAFGTYKTCCTFATRNARSAFGTCNAFDACNAFNTYTAFDACKPTHKHNPACSRSPGRGISHTFAPPAAQHAVSVAHYGNQQKYCCG